MIGRLRGSQFKFFPPSNPFDSAPVIVEFINLEPETYFVIRLLFISLKPIRPLDGSWKEFSQNFRKPLILAVPEGRIREIAYPEGNAQNTALGIVGNSPANSCVYHRSSDGPCLHSEMTEMIRRRLAQGGFMQTSAVRRVDRSLRGLVEMKLCRIGTNVVR